MVAGVQHHRRGEIKHLLGDKAVQAVVLVAHVVGRVKGEAGGGVGGDLANTLEDGGDLVIGGLPGARALGLEPTYFWDALTGDAISWLNEHTDEDEAIVFASNPTSFMYLQRTGKLPRAFTPEHRVGRPKWLVMQDRPGAFRPDERLLISRREPAHVVSKFGVPLLWVFPVGPEEGP